LQESPQEKASRPAHLGFFSAHHFCPQKQQRPGIEAGASRFRL
jgi:hypothetical protein